MSILIDVEELLSFLDMATYLSQFIPRLAILSAPLCDYCQQDSVFVQGSEHEKALSEIKSEISSKTNLQFYNDCKPLTLQVDLSTGLGCGLNPREQGHKEARAVLLQHRVGDAGSCFRTYGFHPVYGWQWLIHTDQKSMESNAAKNITNVPPQLDGMMLTIQQYGIANALSRVKQCKRHTITALDITVHIIINGWPEQ